MDYSNRGEVYLLIIIKSKSGSRGIPEVSSGL